MGVISDHLDLWGEALWGTIALFLGGGLIAVVLGLIVGAARVSPVPIARGVGAVYVNWIRNTPLTLVMFFFAFCLPILLGERVNSLLLATIALGIYTATYVAEAIRAGSNTVPAGQAASRWSTSARSGRHSASGARTPSSCCSGSWSSSSCSCCS